MISYRGGEVGYCFWCFSFFLERARAVERPAIPAPRMRILRGGGG